jgi:hypothetical protein
MDRGEGLFGYRPPVSVDERLRTMQLEIDKHTGEGGNKPLEASLRVSLAEEILEIERNDHTKTKVSLDNMSGAIDQLIRAAKIYDEADRPLDAWRQRARVLSVLREFGHDDLRYRFVDQIDELKAAMDEFGDKILDYTSSVSEVPRYIINQGEVLATNERLGVSDRSIIGDGSAQIGV